MTRRGLLKSLPTMAALPMVAAALPEPSPRRRAVEVPEGSFVLRKLFDDELVDRFGGVVPDGWVFMGRCEKNRRSFYLAPLEAAK